MTRPTIPELPPAPSRADDGPTFAAKADTFLAALPAFRTQTNAVGEFCEEEADRATGQANAATDERVAAQTARTGAEAARDAAEGFRDQAEGHRDAAEGFKDGAEAAAAAAAAGAGLPSLAGNAGRPLRVSPGETSVDWGGVPEADRIVVMDSSGDFTPHPEAQWVFVELWAGGNGGQNFTSATNSLGGAGGIHVSRLFRVADLSAPVAVTIGAGGPGTPNGVNSALDERRGGSTSFGGLLIAPAGPANASHAAMSPATNGLSQPHAGNGGVTGAGGSSIYGGAAGGGATGSTSGAGGTSQFGGAGGAGSHVAAAKGGNGQVPGGGGGGSSNDGGGGDGAPGRARISQW